MSGQAQAFSGFPVGDLGEARRFYGETLGLQAEGSGQGDMRMLVLTLGSGAKVFVRPKETHTPTTFTILDFPIDDIEAAVAELERRGVTPERYAGLTTTRRASSGSAETAPRRSRGSPTWRGTSSPCSGRTDRGQ